GGGKDDKDNPPSSLPFILFHQPDEEDYEGNRKNQYKKPAGSDHATKVGKKRNKPCVNKRYFCYIWHLNCSVAVICIKDEHKKYHSYIYCIMRSALCNVLFVWNFNCRKTGTPVSTTHIAPGLI